MLLNKNTKNFLLIATLMMALSIAIGAFGAHGLKATTDEYMMAIYNTGVEYQFYNTLGLFGIAFITYLLPKSRKIVVAGYMLFIGTLIFSISLYLLVLLKLSWLGAITPIGGTLIIISWMTVFFVVLKEIKIERN